MLSSKLFGQYLDKTCSLFKKKAVNFLIDPSDGGECCFTFICVIALVPGCHLVLGGELLFTH